MNKYILVLCTMVCIALVALADVPRDFVYEGKLFDEAGVPVKGDKTFQISLVRTDNTLAYEWAPKKVKVANGVFSFMVRMPDDPNVFAQELSDARALKVRIKVNGQQMNPDRPLNMVPFALVADYANNVIGDGSNTNIFNSVFNKLNVADTSQPAIIRADQLMFGNKEGRGTPGNAFQVFGTQILGINYYGNWQNTVLGGPVTTIQKNISALNNNSVCGEILYYNYYYGDSICWQGTFLAGSREHWALVPHCWWGGWWWYWWYWCWWSWDRVGTVIRCCWL